MNKLIDTHFHLDLVKDANKLLKFIESNKIYTIAVTNSPTVFHYTKKICENKNYIKPALGLHPELAHVRYDEIKYFEKLINDTKYIGEVGLDYMNADYEIKKKQKFVFQKVLEMCSTGRRKILTIHSRRAEKDVIDMIGDNYNSKIILHWYSGNLSLIEKAIKNGYYFSFNAQMLQTQKGKRILSAIPSNRILTESDGPFAKLNSRQHLSPAYINYTVEAISKIKSMPYKNMKNLIYANFSTLLKS